MHENIKIFGQYYSQFTPKIIQIGTDLAGILQTAPTISTFLHFSGTFFIYSENHWNHALSFLRVQFVYYIKIVSILQPFFHIDNEVQK